MAEWRLSGQKTGPRSETATPWSNGEGAIPCLFRSEGRKSARRRHFMFVCLLMAGPLRKVGRYVRNVKIDFGYDGSLLETSLYCN